MNSLSKTWITDPWIDAEYKSYVLLAYLNDVGLNFEQRKLYPHLPTLLEYYKDALSLKEATDEHQKNFQKELLGFDLEHFQLRYDSVFKNDEMMEEVMKTLDFSIPKMKEYLEKGKQVFEFVEKAIHLLPVGLVPINRNEGYFFVENKTNVTTDVYEFKVSFFEQSHHHYRSVNTQYIRSYPISLMHTYSYIKRDLLRELKQIPNPATYAFESELELPVQECLIPVVKRILIRHIQPD